MTVEKDIKATELKKDTILLSIGPHQVISQFVLSQQLGIKKEQIEVIRTNSPTEGDLPIKNLVRCEAYIHQQLGIEQTATLNSVYKLWGNSKLAKLLNLPILKKKIQQYLKSRNVKISQIKHLILTARYDLGEILIADSFPHLDSVYFISDGNPEIYGNNQTYHIPAYLKLFGFKNLYEQKIEVYFLKANLPTQYKNIIPRELNQSLYSEAKEKLTQSNIFSDWIKEISSATEQQSIVFLQPLENYPDTETNIFLYKKLIRSELTQSNNKILIKPHPREKPKIIQRFKKEMKAEFNDAVSFFNSHFLSSMPIEVFAEKLNLNRIVCMFSSSVYFFKAFDIILYTDKRIPRRYREMTKLAAKELNAQLIDLSE
ncbi:MAG: polysialyltransferase family glycosyltransferase [Bacteroidota bacterium]|nr:polysialyltransferase family glycosyltransferase [Bacteroidota bacterium]